MRLHILHLLLFFRNCDSMSHYAFISRSVIFFLVIVVISLNCDFISCNATLYLANLFLVIVTLYLTLCFYILLCDCFLSFQLFLVINVMIHSETLYLACFSKCYFVSLNVNLYITIITEDVACATLIWIISHYSFISIVWLCFL